MPSDGLYFSIQVNIQQFTVLNNNLCSLDAICDKFFNSERLMKSREGFDPPWVHNYGWLLEFAMLIIPLSHQGRITLEFDKSFGDVLLQKLGKTYKFNMFKT